MPPAEPQPQTHLGLRLFLTPIRWFGLILLSLLGPFRSFNRSNVPRRGGVLLLANHISDLDPAVVQGALTRHVFFMAKSELFEMPILAKVIRWFQAFPVKRGEPDRTAIKRAVQLLQAGEIVCVFPEGQLSSTGRLQELQPGVALIARMAQVPVICVGIRGTTRIVPYGSTMPRPALGWVTASFGVPWNSGEMTATEFINRVRTELLDLTGQKNESPT